MRRCLVIVLLFVMTLAMVSAMTVTAFAGETSVIHEDENVVITRNSDGDFEIEPKDIFACLEVDDNTTTLIINFSSYKSTIESHAGGDLSDKQVILKQSRNKKLKTDVELAHIHFTDDLITGVGEVFASDCKKLQTVKFGNHIKTIARSAFAGCEHLQGTSGTTLDLSYIEMIDDSAFEGDVELRNIQFGENLKTIGKNAFSKGIDIKDLTFPAGLAVIDNGAFSDCSGLQSVKFNGNDRLSYIGDSAFMNCTSLTAVNVTGFNINRLPTGADAITCGTGMFKGCTSLQNLTWPRNFAQIPEGTFSGCTALTRFVFEGGETDSVCESIGNNAFHDCRSLQSIDLPNSVTAIGDSAFAGCSSLTDISIPNKVTTLERDIFRNCTSLKQMFIHEEIDTIYGGAFFGCTAMEAINADENNPTFSSSNGILFNKEQSVLVCYPAGKKDESYIFPEAVSRIGEQAFSGCLYLTSIYYSGTKEQWNNIEKGNKWSYPTKLGNNPAVKQITFKVANGRWNDRTDADKVITVVGDNADRLIGQVIPAVGNMLDDYTFEGSWDSDPSQTILNGDAVFTYSYEKAKLEITVEDKTFVFDGKSKGYDGVTLSDPKTIKDAVSVTGLLNGDSLTQIVLNGTKTDADVYNDVLTAKDAAVKNAAGNDITSKYNIAYVTGKLTVNKAAITPSVSIKGWAYGSTANTPSVEGNPGGGEVTFQYKKTGDPDSSYTGTVPTDAGTYAVDFRVRLENYNEYAGTETVEIAKAAITIKADDKSSKYGASLAPLTYKVGGGYVEGDDLGVALSTDAKKDKPGTYAIRVSWNENPNYTATLTDGAYTVGQKPEAELEPKPEPQPKPKPQPKINRAAAKIALDAGVAARSSGSKVTASWGAVKGASSYVIYANYCDQKTLKKIRTVSGKTTSIDITKLAGKKLNTKKNLKFYVVAYKTAKGKKVKLATSITAHAPGSKNSGHTNITGVKVKKASFKLKKGKTVKIKAKLILQKKGKKPLKHCAKFRYATSNAKVAKVNKKGKITAVGKGKCTVYVYAVSGVSKKIKVTVK